MALDVLPYYEKGRLAMGSGDLMDVFNVDIELKDGSKLLHTLRKSPAGFVQGTYETTGSFDTYIAPEGPEADWLAGVQGRSVNQFRLKLSGITVTIDAKIDSVKVKQAVDDATQFNISFIGVTTI